jgi:hypothetical protein
MKYLGLAGIFILLMALGAGSASALFRWTDGNGDPHISTRLEDIPEQFRKTAIPIAQPGPSPHESCASFPSDPRGGTRMKFFIEQHQPTVHGCINGKGPYKFIFDTGWPPPSFIKPEVLEEIGVKLKNIPVVVVHGKASKVVTIRSLQVGGARLGPMEIMTFPFGVVEDGILGQDFMAKFIVEFDYKNSVLTLTPR